MTDDNQDPRDLRADNVTIRRNEVSNICLRIDGREEWEKVAVKVAFPYTLPGRYVVFTKDGEEVGTLANPGELDRGSRELLGEILEERYLMPAVQRIVSIEDVHNGMCWKVETDRGPRAFEIRDLDSVREIGGQIVIVDADGNRFRISDRDMLDPDSQALLDTYV